MSGITNYLPSTGLKKGKKLFDIGSPTKRLSKQTPADSPNNKSIIEERRHIDVTVRSKSSAKKHEYKRKVEEAFRPDIHYNKITKDIFQYNFKKIGFDLEKVSGEGINHYHIRKMFNRLGYQITGFLSIDALLACKKVQDLGFEQSKPFERYIRAREKMNRSVDNTNIFSDNELLESAISSPINIDSLLIWTINNESSLTEFKKENYSGIRLYHQSACSKDKLKKYLKKRGKATDDNIKIIDSLFDHNLYEGIEENHHFQTHKDNSLTTRTVPQKLQNIRKFTKLLRYADEPYKFTKHIKSKKAIMRLVKDMQVSNRGKSILRKKIQEYKSASPSPEEQETIDSAVFRANQRVLSRTLKERFEEKKHLDIYIRNSFDPVHATWVKKILDPRKLTQTKKVLKISPNSRMKFKDRMRVQQLCESRNRQTL
ncbi:unnamed protein product [Moneuplotes crassus]|uniref:Uncharacterized protein n=1 Tax=Euplotes crassus TaxID=5936 RepID=A0AAD1X6F6_EUPCR|nr:unnamed protein product [Moneuplotes crassus]